MVVFIYLILFIRRFVCCFYVYRSCLACLLCDWLCCFTWCFDLSLLCCEIFGFLLFGCSFVLLVCLVLWFWCLCVCLCCFSFVDWMVCCLGCFLSFCVWCCLGGLLVVCYFVWKLLDGLFVFLLLAYTFCFTCIVLIFA